LKTRLYQLAKELKFEARDLVQLAREHGLDVKSNLSLLDEETVVAIRRVVSEAQRPAEPIKTETHAKADVRQEPATSKPAATAVRETAAPPARERRPGAPPTAVTPPTRPGTAARPAAAAAPPAEKRGPALRPGVGAAPIAEKAPAKVKPTKPIKKEKSK
jgi:translation initiation factor IF-2